MTGPNDFFNELVKRIRGVVGDSDIRVGHCICSHKFTPAQDQWLLQGEINPKSMRWEVKLWSCVLYMMLLTCKRTRSKWRKIYVDLQVSKIFRNSPTLVLPTLNSKPLIKSDQVLLNPASSSGQTRCLWYQLPKGLPDIIIPNPILVGDSIYLLVHVNLCYLLLVFMTLLNWPALTHKGVLASPLLYKIYFSAWWAPDCDAGHHCPAFILSILSSFRRWHLYWCPHYSGTRILHIWISQLSLVTGHWREPPPTCLLFPIRKSYSLFLPF